ncbi:Predicted small secreted protein [Carnobacterium iners]|uniref:Predicted small secreted protein n=1 Tax=Carnobacterium iners TaxID=1073423 RepID=A0A1X7NPZ4_9LACT|nr:PepSY domain-containing protein [Carnobacterium iners]SEK27283.1 Predicted small secreted protein [Carnobacterium iners]SMH40101.1 Predicted small secreted protein [Carnobacterium iners]
MQKKQNEAVKNNLIAGLLFGSGIVCGYFLRRYLQKNVAIHGDTILTSVKRQFLAEGPIEGSWIELKKIPSRKFTLKTDVYYGGISRLEENELVQYEFIADAYSGTILDIYRI